LKSLFLEKGRGREMVSFAIESKWRGLSKIGMFGGSKCEEVSWGNILRRITRGD
jgi:hypothetical protein